MKYIFIIIISLCANLYSSNTHLTDEDLKHLESDATLIFIGTIFDIEKSYYLEVNEKKIKVPFSEVVSYYNDLLYKGKDLGIKHYKSHNKAMIVIGDSIKGKEFTEKIFIYEWDDLFDSMCPHYPTTVANKTKVLILSNHEYDETKNTNDLDIHPIKYSDPIQKIMIQRIEEDKKQKLATLKKIETHISLIKTSKDSEIIDENYEELIELYEYKKVRMFLIDHFLKSKNNQNLESDIIWIYTEMLDSKYHTELKDLPSDIKLKIKSK